MASDHPWIFISSSSADREVAEMIGDALKDAGADVVSDIGEVPPGADVSRWIESAIDAADRVVVLVTPNTQRSQFWAAEVGYALGRGAPIMPVVVGTIDRGAVPSRLNRLQAVIWREGAEKEAIDDIVRASIADAV